MLGIGGGPIDIVALGYLFSMDTREASLNALFIIAISQSASLLIAIFSGGFVSFNVVLLIGMVLAGIIGGLLGSMFHRRLDTKKIKLLFKALMAVIILICVYNLLNRIF